VRVKSFKFTATSDIGVQVQSLRRWCLLVAWALVFGISLSGYAQGTFQNLNFEQANIPSGTQPTDFVPTSAGMPGWNAYTSNGLYGTQAVGLVYDGYTLGDAFVSINDSNTYPGFVVPQGKYCAYLFGGGPAPNYSASISQTGLVPAGTASLRIVASWSLVPFVVTLGGQTINMVPLITQSSYTLYGGDISSFAGQVAQLSFTEPAPPGPDPSRLLLDNITFSTSSVPEPGTCGLILCGAVVIGVNRWRKRDASSKFKVHPNI
jgi:hypothetical protein